MKNLVIVLVLLASPAAAQPIFNTLGEQRNVCKVWDGTDTAAITAAGRLEVDGSGVTQPVSGIIAATQSGTWTVQPGNTANTTPWLASLNEGGVTADILDLTNNNPLTCAIVDGAGSQITSFGGGTQYNQGTATTDTDTLTMSGAVRRDTAAVATGVVDGDRLALSADNAGRLRTTSADVTQPISAASLPLPAGAATAANQDGIVKDGAGDTTQANVSSGRLHVDPGTVTVTDGAGALNVIVDSGSITANAGTNLNTSALALDATLTGRLPAGGSPADNESNTNTSLSRIGGFGFVWDGTTWDRQKGDSTDGTLVNLGANNDVTVTGTVTTTPPANASTNVAQLAGTATSVNSGVKDAGTLRVVIATDQPALTNKLLVTPDSVALPANQSVNAAQFGGTNVSTGTGASGAGIPRVTVANDSAIVQGTAAATTAGWPVIAGNVARTSAAWTSATGLDTTLSLTVTSYPMVAITVNTTTTITGGALIFESSDDSGTTWFAARATRLDSNTTAGTYTLVATTKQGFQTTNAGYTTYRVRLNPAITGTGTVTVALLASSIPVPQDVTVGQATMANLNATVNVSQFGGSAVATGTGTGGAGIPRVTISNDSSLAANQSVNLAQVAGAATQTGNGTAAGAQRFSLASDSTGNIATIGTSVTPGTAAANLGKAEDVAAGSGDTGVVLLGHRNEAVTQLTNAAGDYGAIAIDGYGDVFVRQDHNNRIRCTVTVSTATTIQAVGGSCAAPGAGLSIYITDINVSASAAGIAADAFPTLKYGTGGTCGTGTTVFYGVLSAAAIAGHVWNGSTPIKIPANNEVCWISTTAGSKFLTLTGYIAP